MSRAPSQVLVLAMLMALGACEGSTAVRVDVCARGDRAEIASRLQGYTILALDDDGEIVDSATVGLAGAETSLSFGGAARVRVDGVDLAGALVAEGETALDGGGACVCLAVVGQTAACAGLVCRVEAGECAFFDEATGEPAGTRTVTLPAVEDTYVVASDPTSEHASELELHTQAGERVALVRFDLGSIPRTAVLEDATLALTLLPPPVTPSGVPIAVAPVLAAWTTPACDADTCGTPWATFDPDRASERQEIPLGLHAGPWLTDPQGNHGLALIAGGGPSSFWSSDAAAEAGPELIVRFHMVDDELPPPTDAPICGNGLVEPGEACDDGDRDDLDACTSSCEVARCGDGFQRLGVEECDDGDTENQPECTRLCLRCDDPNADASHVEPDGRCYERYGRAVNYTIAENTCDASGHGMLADFASRAEQNRVLAGLGTNLPDLWIGASDRGTEGEFRTPADAAVTYTAWAVDEPDAAGDNIDCVMVSRGLWQNVGCFTNHGYVCERGGWLVGEGGRALLPVVGPRITWDAARLACQASGAHLATITTEAELTATTGITTSSLWIGLGELDVPDVLAWVTGELATLLNFGSPPVLGGDSFCGYLIGSGRWQVASCASTRRFLCEAD